MTTCLWYVVVEDKETNEIQERNVYLSPWMDAHLAAKELEKAFPLWTVLECGTGYRRSLRSGQQWVRT